MEDVLPSTNNVTEKVVFSALGDSPGMKDVLLFNDVLDDLLVFSTINFFIKVEIMLLLVNAVVNVAVKQGYFINLMVFTVLVFVLNSWWTICFGNYF